MAAKVTTMTKAKGRPKMIRAMRYRQPILESRAMVTTPTVEADPEARLVPGAAMDAASPSKRARAAAPDAS